MTDQFHSDLDTRLRFLPFDDIKFRTKAFFVGLTLKWVVRLLLPSPKFYVCPLFFDWVGHTSLPFSSTSTFVSERTFIRFLPAFSHMVWLSIFWDLHLQYLQDLEHYLYKSFERAKVIIHRQPVP